MQNNPSTFFNFPLNKSRLLYGAVFEEKMFNVKKEFMPFERYILNEMSNPEIGAKTPVLFFRLAR